MSTYILQTLSVKTLPIKVVLRSDLKDDSDLSNLSYPQLRGSHY